MAMSCSLKNVLYCLFHKTVCDVYGLTSVVPDTPMYHMLYRNSVINLLEKQVYNPSMSVLNHVMFHMV